MADEPSESNEQTVSSPTAQPTDEQTNNVDPPAEDAEMEDAEENVVVNPEERSSQTMDHEDKPAEAEPVPSLPHRNRKDATLREFLSKMEDYAPIVCSRLKA